MILRTEMAQTLAQSGKVSKMWNCHLGEVGRGIQEETWRRVGHCIAAPPPLRDPPPRFTRTANFLIFNSLSYLLFDALWRQWLCTRSINQLNTMLHLHGFRFVVPSRSLCGYGKANQPPPPPPPPHATLGYKERGQIARPPCWVGRSVSKLVGSHSNTCCFATTTTWACPMNALSRSHCRSCINSIKSDRLVVVDLPIESNKRRPDKAYESFRIRAGYWKALMERRSLFREWASRWTR